MKRVVGAFATGLLLVGCGDRSPGTTEAVTGLLPTRPPSAATVDPTTTAATPPPTTTATTGEIALVPRPPPSRPRPPPLGAWPQAGLCAPTPSAATPWDTPRDWHTAYGCRYLDPAPLDITPNSDGFFSAVAIVDGDTSFDEARQRSTDRFAVIVLQEETTIGGHRAVRHETEAAGAGLIPKGSRLYSVVIDNEDQAFEVFTAWFPGTSTSEYQARKKLVDEVAKTVRFM